LADNGTAQGQARKKPKSNKVSLSQSPLARPETAIHQLASEIQKYLFLPDPTALYATMGTVAANMIYGNPVWTILVGPPSCGKTEILEMFVNLPNTKVVSVIESIAALLSGSNKRDIAKGATGGLLREIGYEGMLIMTDMAGMLRLPSDPLGKVLAAFRDIYGGRWVRPIGGEGGRNLVWGPLHAPPQGDERYGKLTFLAAATPTIDRHHTMNAELGERWVYYRYPDGEGDGETRSALRNKNPQEAREEMRVLIANFFRELPMDFVRMAEKRDYTLYEEMRIAAMAKLCVRVRSLVPREGWKREVADMADSERPQRLATVLGQLYLGLEAIGLPEGERWYVVGKMAVDSCPRLRSEVMKVLWGQKGLGPVDLVDIALALRLYRSQPVVTRAIEDLEIHGIVTVKKEQGEKSTVEMTDDARDLYEKAGWNGIYEKEEADS
jgi:hypothetical protein